MKHINSTLVLNEFQYHTKSEKKKRKDKSYYNNSNILY